MLVRLLQLFLLLCCFTSVHAANPDKPVRLVIPFAPGGGNDQLGRLLAERLTSLLETPVVVENRPGAGGNIGAELVARAAPDGHTLLLTSNQVVINPALYPTLRFDVMKDLVPVGMAAHVQFVLVANPATHLNSIADLVQREKSAATALTHGTPGNGTPQHLAAELFNKAAGVALIHVPYKGTGPMMNDLLGGQVQLAFATLPAAAPYIRSGKLLPLAVTGTARSPLLPSVPTAVESGLQGYEASTWYGLLAPSHTDRAVLMKVETALRSALEDQVFRARLVELGFEPRFMTAPAMREQMSSDLKKWSALVKAAHVHVD